MKLIKFIAYSFLLLLIVSITSLVGGYFYIKTDLDPVSPDSKTEKLFYVGQGMPLNTLLKNLEKDKLIKSYKSVKIYYWLTGSLKNIKPGYYMLSASMPVSQIMDKIVKGDVYRSWLTIPEGFDIKKTSKRIAKRGFSSEKYKDLTLQISDKQKSKFSFLSNIPKGMSLEGYLFPDTYEVTGANEESLVNLQLKSFEGTIYKYWKENPAVSSLSFHQAVTLASIVELEAQKPSERETIAGVFINRLRLGIPLGSDPTVEYALGWHQDHKGLTFNDVKIDSPYNTYRNAGLPPGPIANPGLACFKAVLDYEATPYLYFVAKGDGSHVFTKTYSEHLRAQSLIVRGLLR